MASLDWPQKNAAHRCNVQTVEVIAQYSDLTSPGNNRIHSIQMSREI